MEIKIKKISLGLRHRRMFRIPEIAGGVIDKVIHDSQSPFNKENYERTDALLDNRGENKGRVLVDASGDNSLAIDIDSVIFNTTTDDIDATLKELTDTYIPYITKNIHKDFTIENFNRIGIVYEFSVTGDPAELLSRITNGNFTSAQNGLFKFASKEVDSRSRVMKDLLDYKNYLIAIGFDEDTFLAKFDYQFYFDPEIKSTGDIEFKAFLDESKQKLDSKFLNWLKVDEEQKQS